MLINGNECANALYNSYAFQPLWVSASYTIKRGKQFSCDIILGYVLFYNGPISFCAIIYFASRGG